MEREATSIVVCGKGEMDVIGKEESEIEKGLSWGGGTKEEVWCEESIKTLLFCRTV